MEPSLAALARELELLAAAMPRRRRLAQLHWGGGTPYYLNQRETAQLWGLLAQHFDLAPGLDASIEVNPELLDREAVWHLRTQGVPSNQLRHSGCRSPGAGRREPGGAGGQASSGDGLVAGGWV
ncbi:MAG: hypothetical protein VKP70_09040 [Cyanobacteriota bacterium]|nr:hypothetical protein [Cyanobacteriota bacterium]